MVGRVVGTERASSALVVRSSPLGEADSMVTLLTEDRGLVDAHAPSARRPARTKRLFLEPLHTLRVTLLDRPGRDLPAVRQAIVSAPRTAILGSLPALEAGGQLLRWIRSGMPKNQPEPAIWHLALAGLDALNEHALATRGPLPGAPSALASGELGAIDADDAPPHDEATRASDRGESVAIVATVGLRLLSAHGYDLELRQCVRCGRPCPPGRPAYLDPAAGGIRCVACGGGPFLVSAALRAEVLGVQAPPSTRVGAGPPTEIGAEVRAGLSFDGAREVSRWLTMAFDAHAGAPRFAKLRGR
jgi:DNA repair protein RecO (recombination protein O)